MRRQFGIFSCILVLVTSGVDRVSFPDPCRTAASVGTVLYLETSGKAWKSTDEKNCLRQFNFVILVS